MTLAEFHASLERAEPPPGLPLALAALWRDGRGDWDLLPGAIHTWELVEFFHTLRALGYDDWFAFDAVPKEQDPVEFFSAAARLTCKLEAISRRIEPQKLAELQERRSAANTVEYLHSLI